MEQGNNTESKRDEFDLALEDMKMDTKVDLDRLIEKRVKQMMVRTSLKVVLVVLLIAALIFLGVMRKKASEGMKSRCAWVRARSVLLWGK